MTAACTLDTPIQWARLKATVGPSSVAHLKTDERGPAAMSPLSATVGPPTVKSFEGTPTHKASTAVLCRLVSLAASIPPSMLGAEQVMHMQLP